VLGGDVEELAKDRDVVEFFETAYEDRSIIEQVDDGVAIGREQDQTGHSIAVTIEFDDVTGSRLNRRQCGQDCPLRGNAGH
jgi:hypothetical protein